MDTQYREDYRPSMYAVIMANLYTMCFLQSYSHTHHKEMELPSIARMIQTMLYGKRFFPFYTYVIRKSSMQ